MRIGLKPAKARRFTIIELFIGGFLLILVAYIAFLLFFEQNPYWLDSDVVNDISFRQESYEQRSLWPEGFVGPSESLTSRPVLLYWLFYGITGNFMLSYQLEVFTTLLFLLLALYYLMGKVSCCRAVKLVSLCLFLIALPYGVRYVFFFPTNVSVLHAVAVLMTLALRIDLWRKFDGIAGLKQRAIWTRLLMLLGIAAAMGYTTIKMAMALYLPLLCVDVLRVLFDFIHRRPTNRSAVFMMIVSAATLIINCAFWAAFLHFRGDTINPQPFFIHDISAWLNWDVLSAQILCVLRAFGLTGGGELGSMSGIQFLLSCCITAVGIISLIWLIGRAKRGKDVNETHEITWFWLASTSVIFLLLMFSATTISIDRYYFATSLLLPALCGMALNDWIRQDTEKIVWWPCIAIGLVLLLMFGITVKTNAAQYTAEPPDLAKAAQYIEGNGYRYVSASFWNAGVIKGYTNGAVETQHSSSIVNLEPLPWLIDVRKFEQEQLGVPNILLLTDEEEAAIYNAQDFVYWLLEDHAEKVTEIGVFNLYALTENPYTLIEKVKIERAAGLPLAEFEKKIDYPSNIGFHYPNAALNDRNELVSSGAGGYILCGPYSNSIAGTYDITLHYVVDSAANAGDVGIFDVALDLQQHAVMEFTAADHSVTLENVVIEDGHLFEVRVLVPEGMIVRIQFIEYERVSP